MAKRGKAALDPNRDESGRWLPGHRQPGPGNKRQSEMARIRNALRSIVKPEDVELAWRKLVELAAEGNALACREVLDRTLGRGPIPSRADVAPNVSTIDGALDAFGQIAAAYGSGDLTAEEAETASRIIARAAKVHDARSMSQLAFTAGSGVLVAPSEVTPEEWIEGWRGSCENDNKSEEDPSEQRPTDDPART